MRLVGVDRYRHDFDISQPARNEMATSISNLIKQNTLGQSEGFPAGVPTSYNWYKGWNDDGLKTPPSNFTAVEGWGQVYQQEGTPASNSNATVDVANAKTYVHIKQTGQWVLVQDQSKLQLTGGHFVTDFAGNAATPMKVNPLADGGTSFDGPPSGYNDHFWYNARGTYTAGTVDGVYVQMDMKTTDPNANLVASVGADWWRDANAPYLQDHSNNPGIGSSNWVKLSTDWKSVGYYSMSTADFQADPAPPLQGSAQIPPVQIPPVVSSDTLAPASPSITSFTPDTGTVGDRTTDSHSPTPSGTAEADKVSSASSPLAININNATSAPPATSSPALSQPVDKNLLVNGSFEASSLAPYQDGRWGAFSSIPGWTAVRGGTIELWNNLDNVKASDGGNYGELDYLGARDGSHQDVKTVAGRSYDLSFDARTRPGSSASTTSIEASWNGSVVGVVPPGNTWKTYDFNVTGTGGQDRLTFRELAGQSADGLGGLYDNVSLVAKPTSTAPASALNTAHRAMSLMAQYAATDFVKTGPSAGTPITARDVNPFLAHTLVTPGQH
jgi:hypothetical protein